MAPARCPLLILLCLLCLSTLSIATPKVRQPLPQASSLVDVALAWQQAFVNLDAQTAASLLSPEAVLLIDGQIIFGAANITTYLTSVFSSAVSILEVLSGEPVMTTNFVAWEKLVTVTFKTGTVVQRTELEWFEFDADSQLILAVTSIYNDTAAPSPSAPTDPRIAAALQFQVLQSSMNATALGALFAPNGVTNIPIGVATNEGRDAIVSSFATYFSTLVSNEETIVGEGLILSDFLNTVGFTKVITATAKSGTVTKNFVVNWFVFQPLFGNNSLPLIESFSAAFNLSSSFSSRLHHAARPSPRAPLPAPKSVLPSCLQTALASFSGQVCLPNSTCYAATVQLDNERLVSAPLVVLWPATNADVATAVLAARTCKLPFSVRGGGHSAAGYCLTQGGVTVDMRLFNTTSFATPGYYTTGAGLIWADIYARAAAANVSAVVGGTCATVGVGGFTQGGGYSRLSRAYGLAVDALVSVTAVLANGTITELSATTGDADLWWAVRGGGGGNFAVITSFTFRTAPMPSPVVWELSAVWPPSAYPKLLQVYTYWAAALQHTISAYLMLTPTYAWLQLVDFTNGGAGQQAFAVISKLVPGAFNVSSANVNFLQWEIATSGATGVDGRYAYVVSDLLNSTALAATSGALVSAILAPPTPWCMVILGHLGGVINTVPAAATAYPYRDADFVLEVKSIWLANDTVTGPVAMAWASSLRDRVYKTAGVAPYINYMDPELPVSAYYGANYARLQAVKRAVDPSNFFQFAMSIPLN